MITYSLFIKEVQSKYFTKTPFDILETEAVNHTVRALPRFSKADMLIDNPIYSVYHAGGRPITSIVYGFDLWGG